MRRLVAYGSRDKTKAIGSCLSKTGTRQHRRHKYALPTGYLVTVCTGTSIIFYVGPNRRLHGGTCYSRGHCVALAGHNIILRQPLLIILTLTTLQAHPILADIPPVGAKPGLCGESLFVYTSMDMVPIYGEDGDETVLVVNP
ncbi:hypothetical protein CONLIGDRAFT_451204 [Coniochaeta ligniaria NRRL 30616]|uniref:Uncharacterized protein n=1 Tax=Coniochaeta ligniaria NRRL 30616 TaxID=1408157 RepID=A0A1J7IJZ2_9PEZI|nr:hypothetical protein CONLIGDRAFT_451204 [Coniochaeta ligniaria NRRL 30616]